MKYAITNRSKKAIRFRAKNRENMDEYIASCIETCDDLNIDYERKLKVCNKVFEVGAKRRCRSSISKNASS